MRASNTRAQLAALISESAWTTQVVNIAKLYGLQVFHPLPAMARKGRWVTATQGDVGYPDLTIAFRGRVIFAELKSQRGRLSPAQRIWQQALPDEYFVWRPSDIEEVKMVLRAMAGRVAER